MSNYIENNSVEKMFGDATPTAVTTTISEDYVDNIVQELFTVKNCKQFKAGTFDYNQGSKVLHYKLFFDVSDFKKSKNTSKEADLFVDLENNSGGKIPPDIFNVLKSIMVPDRMVYSTKKSKKNGNVQIMSVVLTDVSKLLTYIWQIDQNYILDIREVKYNDKKLYITGEKSINRNNRSYNNRTKIEDIERSLF